MLLMSLHLRGRRSLVRKDKRNATQVRIEKREFCVLSSESAEKLTTAGEKQISRFIMTTIKREYTFMIWNRKIQGGPSSLKSLPKIKNNAHALFASVDSLTNPPVSVASELLSIKACNKFAAFFTDKIQKIRRVSLSGTGCVVPVST